ncbi:MAG: protein kinase [Burkholderiales bacterium]
MSEATVYRNALELDSTLQEYRLTAVLGAGGFGMTYLAWDSNLEKKVAIKEYLPGDLALRALDGSVVPVSTDHQHDYSWGLERFIQEARTLARFSHPHIVRVSRYFEANGTGYMVMDYEDGEPLNQLLKRMPRPDEAELRRIVLPLLDGLAAVHAEKFLHRDIKPGNIFMRANGTPVLLDFGAARAAGGATRSLTAVLTPGFAPLEQYATDGKQGPWTDIYAMGGVLYRAVTDKNPPDAVSRLQGDTLKEGLAAAAGRYGAPLLRAIEWAMAIKPEMRPQSVAEWKAALEAGPAAAVPRSGTLVAGTQAATQRNPATLRTVPVKPDHGAAWKRVGWTAVMLITAVAAVGWYRRQPDPPPPQPAAAPPVRERPPVQVEVIPVQPPSLQPGSPAVEADMAMVKPGDKRPARERYERPDAGLRGPVPSRDRVFEEFRGADRNNDGYLSPLEVEGRFPVIARDFAGVDRDGDRRVSLDEFADLRQRQLENRRPLPRR